MACICLHNYLRRSKSSQNIYTKHDIFDEEMGGKIVESSWRQDREKNSLSLLLIQIVARKSAQVYKDNRKKNAEYFATVGKVPWQELYL